jgi:hypothetical protein
MGEEFREGHKEILPAHRPGVLRQTLTSVWNRALSLADVEHKTFEKRSPTGELLEEPRPHNIAFRLIHKDLGIHEKRVTKSITPYRMSIN